MNIKDAFYWKGHVWVVISLPDLDTGEVAIANFTSWTMEKDHACTLHKGEHSSVIHDTVVEYAGAQLLHPSFFPAFEQSATPTEAVTDDVLERMQAGADESEFTPLGVVAAVEASVPRQIDLKRRGLWR